jgi:hypothetical protein
LKKIYKTPKRGIIVKRKCNASIPVVQPFFLFSEEEVGLEPTSKWQNFRMFKPLKNKKYRR